MRKVHAGMQVASSKSGLIVYTVKHIDWDWDEQDGTVHLSDDFYGANAKTSVSNIRQAPEDKDGLPILDI